MKLGEILKSKRLYLDGAMGSLLQNKLAAIGPVPEVLNLTHPELIKEIHQLYIDAGANIILSNTFGVNGYKLKGCNYTVEQLVTAGVHNAKALNPDYVALDVGPLGTLIGALGEMPFDQAVDYFKEVITAGDQAGADLIVIETITDICEARAALIAAKAVSELPVIVSMTYEENARTLTGSDALTVVNILEALGADAIGINCSTGPDAMLPIIADLVRYASVPIMVEPNAGLPHMKEGKTVYDITIDQFTQYMVQIAEMGALILGGCCGTTPAYIEKMKQATVDLPLFPVTAKGFTAVSSSTKTIILGDDIHIIGECINPTTNPVLKASLRAGELSVVTQLAVDQKKDGADILDINLGLPDIDEEAMMQEAVDTVSKLVDCPLQIDSSNPEVIEAVLRSYPGKAIINSVNGKQSSMAAIFPIAKKYGALVLGLTMDESGIPSLAGDRFAIAEKIITTAKSYGIPEKNILIDALVLTASAQQAEVRETIKTLEKLRAQLGVPTVLGVSNISFGLPNRELLNRTFLAMALEAGLTTPIMNPGDQEMMDTIKAFRALWGFDGQCIAYANAYKDKSAAVTKAETGRATLGLKAIIEEGLTDQAAAATAILLKTREPLDIVNNEIVPALDAVGDAFETGECFLPHLIFAAETAQQAFEVIKETMTQAGQTQVAKGKIVLATVEGDVHDIGKNILKVILENYGYEIVDLGKDVKADIIIQTIKAEGIKLVGLSALMTTTVKNMEKIITEIKVSCPGTIIMVGGAVLNPEYAQTIGADFYGKDAREGAGIAKTVFA
ncbi:homocysteine S-methyltransferase family protein [Acetobacterium wieringae]|uniref:homocysteine S-methyltransferase family protein n=1 Tax=Acetobacterium wieringae TaxID=52694 RepID=UPI002B21C213|nr:homocysteine S-methyltransferase family protein [Acetobacterium wieringae]MEA4806788.1 homocysteine S-methyltransferase family protein [Acetobacterium wieringae]